MFSTLSCCGTVLFNYWHCAGVNYQVSPKLFRGCSLSKVRQCNASNSFKPPLHSCAAGVLFQLSTKLFWEDLYVLDSFVKINFLKKDLPSFLPRCQKSANACPRLYLLPAIKSQGSARNLCETEKVDWTLWSWACVPSQPLLPLFLSKSGPLMMDLAPLGHPHGQKNLLRSLRLTFFSQISTKISNSSTLGGGVCCFESGQKMRTTISYAAVSGGNQGNDTQQQIL